MSLSLLLPGAGVTDLPTSWPDEPRMYEGEAGALDGGIQRETGYSNYSHTFVTPPGRQRLLHHGDQQMAVIVRIAGIKRWQLWRDVSLPDAGAPDSRPGGLLVTDPTASAPVGFC